MERDVKEYVQRCCRCLVSKSPEHEARAPLEGVKTSRTLELVCIDFWSAEDSSNKSLDVHVVSTRSLTFSYNATVHETTLSVDVRQDSQVACGHDVSVCAHG